MPFPQPDPRRYEAEAEIKIRERERMRGLSRYPEGTSRLSRRAYVLIQLGIMLLIIIGMIIAFHLLH